MTSTQKRWLEWPFILLLIIIAQAVEISLLQKGPAFLGAIHLIPIVMTYVALTREWLKATGIVVVLAVLGSATVAVPLGLFVGSQVWTALFAKVLISVMALEGRRVFCFLVMGAQLFSKGLLLILMSQKGRTPEALSFWLLAFSSASVMGILSWFVYPFLLWWDRFFEHNEDDSPELNPRFQ